MREALREIPVFERIDADQEACRLAIAALRAQQKTERFRAKLVDRHDEFLKQAIQDSDSCLCCLAGAIHGVVRMLDEEVEMRYGHVDDHHSS